MIGATGQGCDEERRRKIRPLRNEANSGIAVMFAQQAVENLVSAGKAHHLISWISTRDCRSKACSWRRWRMASRVNRPFFNAFLLPRGAPDPGAPPCIRHRLFPLTAGAMQGLPERVLAPQRMLESIGPVLRG
jgi:hypothetical protein